ncbi:MAG: iron-sulfur cluster assembly scaffold protein [Desulfobacteraceae bacterium]|nr:MAG: iron-sulfur cluster assembly scaffold protein [Desulfobacteraceae bacterium]
MTDNLDDFVIRLQNRIYEEAMAAYGKTGFERWQNPLYRGTLENPDGYARVRGSCGDTMQIFLRFKDETVAEAAFQTDGCATTTVCGSMIAELALGKSPDEIVKITGETILEMMPGLPEGEKHCAFLAAETLQAALDQYMKKAFVKPVQVPPTGEK